jgi:hypothetical protein
MRARTAIVSLICASALILTGCSTGIAGVAQLPGAAGAGSSTGDNWASGAPQSDQSSAGSSGSSDPGSSDPGSSDPGSSDPGSSDAGSGDGGDSGLPSASGDTSGLPTDLGSLPTDLGSLPTDLGSIPGLDPGCLEAASILITVPFLFLTPTMGGKALTQGDVDKAFGNLGDIPDELKEPVQVLHDAAVQAIGKSGTEASQILSSDAVTKALDTISSYSDAKCGGS